ncbi:MAG: sulfatase-like hydrolase/transferase, partial [Pseudomonadota bacterium]
RPWMLTVSFTHPHSPFVIAQEFWDLYDRDDIALPAVPPLALDEMDHLSRNLHYCQARHLFTVTDDHRRTARHAYFGMISYVDSKIAMLREALDRSGMAEDTVIVVTADHGEMMGERGMWYKQHFFEWACRVPMIFHAPGQWAPARVAEAVSLVDLMPTFLDLAEGSRFAGYVDRPDGQSLTTAISGDTAALRDLAISEFAADGSTGPSRMVRQGPWKFMALEGVDTCLYNVAQDPQERQNLAGLPEHAETEARLRAICFEGWEMEAWRHTIAADQQRRLMIHRATGGEPTYVNLVRLDDGARYIRNAGAADTKARARLPYVLPAEPDKL